MFFHEKVLKQDRENIFHVYPPLLGEEKTLQINHGGITAIKAKPRKKGKELQTEVHNEIKKLQKCKKEKSEG